MKTSKAIASVRWRWTSTSETATTLLGTKKATKPSVWLKITPLLASWWTDSLSAKEVSSLAAMISIKTCSNSAWEKWELSSITLESQLKEWNQLKCSLHLMINEIKWFYHMYQSLTKKGKIRKSSQAKPAGRRVQHRKKQTKCKEASLNLK